MIANLRMKTSFFSKGNPAQRAPDAACSARADAAAELDVLMRTGHGDGAGEEGIRVHHLVALVDAEMQARRGVLRVAGVAAETEEAAGSDFHPFVEAGRPAVEVRVVERRAVLRRQPDAVAAELLVADVADDPIRHRDDLGAARREDADPFVHAPAGPRIVRSEERRVG